MIKKLAISLVIIVITSSIWWSLPVRFLDDVKVNDVMHIEVFNRNSGEIFTIENKDDISYIVSNIQNITMKREKLSIGYMGTLFTLKFYSANGKLIDQFIVNSNDTIRKDPFFYKVTERSLCVDYLKDLEESLKLD